jgi:hypothetical protein
MVALSYWLAVRLVRRQSQGKPGSRRSGAWFMAIVILHLMLSVPLALWTGNELRILATYPAQEARVVSHTSEVDTCTDDDETYACTKYTAEVDVLQADGQRAVMPTNTRSTEPPVIGETRTVVLVPGEHGVHERSFGTVALLVGGLLMATFMGYLLYLVVAYGAGRSIRKAANLGVAVVMLGVIPAALLGMEAMFVYVPYRYFFLGEQEGTPLWAVLVSSMFAVVLFPVLAYGLQAGINDWLRKFTKR